MKPYPFEDIEIYGFDFNSSSRPIGRMRQPTEEALKNFESFLNPLELKFYDSLKTMEKLNIALSSNPFNAFQDMWNKK